MMPVLEAKKSVKLLKMEPEKTTISREQKIRVLVLSIFCSLVALFSDGAVYEALLWVAVLTGIAGMALGPRRDS